MISLVVPTYRERSNIEPLVKRVETALAATGEAFELIIVDDDSPDGTSDEVQRLSAEGRPWLRVLVRENERDLSTAVISGWRIARGDVLGCMDADLQHPPELLPKLVAEIRRGAEIVVGSRNVAGGGVSDWSIMRRFISWAATLMATAILPGTLGSVTDPMSGLFLVRRSVLEHAALNPIGYKILLEVLARGDYTRATEVPFVFEERKKGGSKMNAATAWKYLAHLVRISAETGEGARVLKYALVGLSGAAVHLFALYLFIRWLGWAAPFAALGGAAFAIMNNFIWNDRFTFQETRVSDPGWTQAVGRFVSFSVFSITGLALNVCVIWALNGLFHVRLMWSALAGVSIAAVSNFVLNSNLTWRAWWDRKLLSRSTQQREKSEAQEGLAIAPCNLCGSLDGRILYAGRTSGRSHVSPQAFRCTSEEHGDFTNIVQCVQCGLLYENPREPEAEIETQYDQVVDPTYESEADGRVRTFSHHLKDLARFISPGRVLDVGCYTGVFLDCARQRGWQTFGVEPSAWAARRANEKGHAVVHAPLRKSNLQSDSYDLVTFWDVIEHLHDPLGQLKEAYRVLQPGGVLALSTKNVGCTFARLAGRRWPWFMRMHLYYFTPGTITQFLRAAGFHVMAIERHKRVISARYLFEKVGAVLGPLQPWIQFLGKPFGRVFVTVDLGDQMSVFARKPAEGTKFTSKAGVRMVTTSSG
jgi:dolichol-phosphate mannosyltransferase